MRGIFFAIVLLLPVTLLANKDYLGYQERITEIYESKKDAVVRVLGQYENLDAKQGEPDVQIDIGTGFFISSDGLVMTVANVAEKAKQFGIEHKGVIYPANLIGYDTYTNVAILLTAIRPRDVKPIQLSDTMGIPKVSTLLLGITCKMGLDPGPSTGMVTGLHTAFLQKTLPTTCLRTSIPSDGGEGGSPVFDLNGRFVGMMTISISTIRSSFVIPARAILRVRDDLISQGRVSYAFLGIELDRDISVSSDHLVVAKAVSGGPAQVAGVQSGDLIMEVDGVKITGVPDLQDATFFARPGQFSSVKVSRGGKLLSLPIKMQEQPIAQLAALAESVSEPVRIDASKADQEQEKIVAKESVSVKKSAWNSFLNR